MQLKLTAYKLDLTEPYISLDGSVSTNSAVCIVCTKNLHLIQL